METYTFISNVLAFIASGILKFWVMPELGIYIAYYKLELRVIWRTPALNIGRTFHGICDLSHLVSRVDSAKQPMPEVSKKQIKIWQKKAYLYPQWLVQLLWPT